MKVVNVSRSGDDGWAVNARFQCVAQACEVAEGRIERRLKMVSDGVKLVPRTGDQRAWRR